MFPGAYVIGANTEELEHDRGHGVARRPVTLDCRIETSLPNSSAAQLGSAQVYAALLRSAHVM